MKRTDLLAALRSLALFSVLFLFPSCLDDDSLEQADTYEGTFEACWQTLDERYCYFDEKNLDWDAVYRFYKPLVRDSVKTQFQLFSMLDQMLSLLRDGHVNLYSPFNTARYQYWYQNYPVNFDANLLDRYYLGANYAMTSGMKYGTFPTDSIGYIRYSSFDSSLGATNLDYIMAVLRRCNGLIIDIRNNGGGALTNAVALAQRFAARKTLYGYMRHKTGPGHNQFSEPEPLYVEPLADRYGWDPSERPVVILTNRHCYSSANQFVQIMQSLDGQLFTDSLGQQHPAMIKLCGDRTGGGSGMPFESVLPNGWTLRFSACPMYDAKMQSSESGIDPTPELRVDMDSLSAYEHHRDDIIEAARAYILNNTRMVRKKQQNEENPS